MEVREHGKFRQAVFSACTRESCSGQCSWTWGQGAWIPVIISQELWSFGGEQVFVLLLLFCVSGSHSLSANHVNN